MRWLEVLTVLVTAGVTAAATKEQYRVLILGPVASRSLHNLCSTLAVALGEAGHDVTHVTSFNVKPSHKNSRVWQVLTGADNSVMEDMNLFHMKDNTAELLNMLFDIVDDIGNQMWDNEEIKQLWHKRNTFHAIIIIGYGNEIALPFLLDYRGVFISLCTPGIEINIIAGQGNWLPFSVVPTITSYYTMEMTFFERAMNPLIHAFFQILFTYKSLPYAQSFLEKKFPGMPPIEEFYANSSLTLINGHFSIDGQVPLLPTQVEIGTITAKRPEPLRQELEEFVDAAGEDGVILFSLGSIVRSTHVDKKYKDILVKAFQRLPQRVVWKYEGDDLQLPSNVLTKAWVPQQDILGHNKTRLFISHCGNLGQQEAQYHGVPVLGLPLAFDQPRNAHRMAKNGYGLVLQWNELSVETLLEAIHTLIYTPRYREKLQSVSRALQDQKESPAERATWWMEYVIRHKGAQHLVYAGKRFHYLQYVMVDVVVFWLTVVLSWLLLSLYCLKKVMNRCTKPIIQNPEDKKYK